MVEACDHDVLLFDIAMHHLFSWASAGSKRIGLGHPMRSGYPSLVMLGFMRLKHETVEENIYVLHQPHSRCRPSH